MAVIDAISVQRFVLVPGAISLVLFIWAAASLHRRFPRGAASSEGEWLNRAWLFLWAAFLWVSIFQTCVIISLFMYRVELRASAGMWLLGLIGLWNVYYSYNACGEDLAAIRGRQE